MPWPLFTAVPILGREHTSENEYRKGSSKIEQQIRKGRKKKEDESRKVKIGERMLKNNGGARCRRYYWPIIMLSSVVHLTLFRS